MTTEGCIVDDSIVIGFSWANVSDVSESPSSSASPSVGQRDLSTNCRLLDVTI